MYICVVLCEQGNVGSDFRFSNSMELAVGKNQFTGRDTKLLFFIVFIWAMRISIYSCRLSFCFFFNVPWAVQFTEWGRLEVRIFLGWGNLTPLTVKLAIIVCFFIYLHYANVLLRSFLCASTFWIGWIKVAIFLKYLFWGSCSRWGFHCFLVGHF